MSLKALELQIALPKTFEAGKLLEQTQQQVNNSQVFANQALQKQIKKNGTMVLESDQSSEVKDEYSNKKENKKKQSQNKNPESANDEQIQHPFKGHFVDFSG